MAEIHVLDKHTAELIAAGEVVERPASVVKELLENSIDAGASQITVSIESGGVRLIEISDNGTGIEAKYIPTAFIRHATSKIRTEDDLTSIHTLGFRGEALASIASVARVEVLTRTEADECASLYRIEGGEEQPIEPGARGVGTTIRVCDLFFNTPARMKFLKKDSSEGTFVADIVGHVATLLPKSVTTAISMDVAAELGGIAALTGAIVILTGIAGNLLAESVCKWFHITDPIAKGVGIGTSAHAVGTSKALQMGEVEGAMSGLSIAVAGVLTAVLCPLFVGLIH